MAMQFFPPSSDISGFKYVRKWDLIHEAPFQEITNNVVTEVDKWLLLICADQELVFIQRIKEDVFRQVPKFAVSKVWRSL